MKNKVDTLNVNRVGVYSVVAESPKYFVEYVFEQLRSGCKQKNIVCLNPHSYVVAQYDTAFSRALKNASWLIPDGIGVVKMSALWQPGIKYRIAGHDVFELLSEQLNEIKGSVFFLGSSEKTLEKIKRKYSSDYPGIRIVGTYSPPFKNKFEKTDIDLMISAINKEEVSVLWVAMTAPKQEKWLEEVLPRLNIGVAVAIGAVFDFYAGNVVRPSNFAQRMGIEWLTRLVQEPKRLWKRTFISGPRFLWYILRSFFGFK